MLTRLGTQPDAVVRVDLASVAVDKLRRGSTLAIDAGDISVAEAVEFPTAVARAHNMFYYPPRNKDFDAPAASGRRSLSSATGARQPQAARRSTCRIQY